MSIINFPLKASRTCMEAEQVRKQTRLRVFDIMRNRWGVENKASREAVLPGLSSEEQILQGEAAGKELRTIHTVVPDAEINGYERRYAKYLDKKRKVGELGLCFHKQGQISGYFDGKIPDRFWEKYNLFVALNQHATLLGSSSNGKVQQALEKIESTIEGHDFAGGGPPIWFRETSK